MDADPSGSPYRSAGVQASAAMAMLGISALFNLADAGVSGWVIGQLSEASTPDGLTLSAAERIDSLNMALMLTRIGLFVATAAAFLTWLHRAVANAIALGYAMPCTPAGAVGNWFIPCYNFFWWWKIGNELWRASVRASADEAPTGPSVLVASWYFTYLAAAAVSRAGGMQGMGSSWAAFRSQTTAALASSSLFAVSAVLGVLVVREITRGQQRLFAASSGSAMAPPTTF